MAAAGARRLFVLRHAKSSWADAQLADHDRPLAARGRADSARLVEFMRREEIAPELVLCSSSLRTRETLAAIMSALEGEVELRIEDGLYAASADELVQRLRALPDASRSVMLIGHNPGVQELVARLVGGRGELGAAAERFPTGALAVLAPRSRSWSGIEEEGADLLLYVAPRDLR